MGAHKYVFYPSKHRSGYQEPFLQPRPNECLHTIYFFPVNRGQIDKNFVMFLPFVGINVI